jgi:hypothetical protein
MALLPAFDAGELCNRIMIDFLTTDPVTTSMPVRRA